LQTGQGAGAWAAESVFDRNVDLRQTSSKSTASTRLREWIAAKIEESSNPATRAARSLSENSDRREGVPDGGLFFDHLRRKIFLEKIFALAP
jgi:hypothetical protein